MMKFVMLQKEMCVYSNSPPFLPLAHARLAACETGRQPVDMCLARKRGLVTKGGMHTTRTVYRLLLIHRSSRFRSMCVHQPIQVNRPLVMHFRLCTRATPHPPRGCRPTVVIVIYLLFLILFPLFF